MVSLGGLGGLLGKTPFNLEFYFTPLLSSRSSDGPATVDVCARACARPLPLTSLSRFVSARENNHVFSYLSVFGVDVRLSRQSEVILNDV